MLQCRAVSHLPTYHLFNSAHLLGKDPSGLHRGRTIYKVGDNKYTRVAKKQKNYKRTIKVGGKNTRNTTNLVQAAMQTIYLKIA